MSINRTATDLTDDPGDLQTGTIFEQAWKTLLDDAIDARWSEKTITLTGSQNNVSLIDSSREADVLRCNNASDLTITGIGAPVSPAKPGKTLIVVSVGAGHVFLRHQNAGSTVANRLINVATSGDTPLAAGSGVAVLVYDGTAERWRLVAHEQGAPITPAFAAGDYTGDGTITWTVESGDVTTFAYLLRGKMLRVDFLVATTSTGGSASTQLKRTVPGGFTATKTMGNNFRAQDAGGTRVSGTAFVLASGTTISFTKTDFSNWSAAASNNTEIFGHLEFEVT